MIASCCCSSKNACRVLYHDSERLAKLFTLTLEKTSVYLASFSNPYLTGVPDASHLLPALCAFHKSVNVCCFGSFDGSHCTPQLREISAKDKVDNPSSQPAREFAAAATTRA